MGKDLGIGAVFRAARKTLGISIEEVSCDLKVKTRYIIALEQNSLNTMDEHPYLIGFIKSYAKMLKIEDKTIEEYLKNTSNKCGTSNKKHQLLNLNNEQSKSPSRDDLVNAMLIFIIIYLLLISFSQFQAQTLPMTDLIINQLNQAK